MCFQMMCSSCLQGTHVRETGRYFSGRWTSPFLKTGDTIALSQSFGSFPVSIDSWKMKRIAGASWRVQVFSRMLGNKVLWLCSACFVPVQQDVGE